MTIPNSWRGDTTASSQFVRGERPLRPAKHLACLWEESRRTSSEERVGWLCVRIPSMLSRVGFHFYASRGWPRGPSTVLSSRGPISTLLAQQERPTWNIPPADPSGSISFHMVNGRKSERPQGSSKILWAFFEIRACNGFPNGSSRRLPL